MSFQEKNITVTLVNFSLMLGYLLIRVLQMMQSDTFDAPHVFRLWGVIIVLAVVVTISATILTHMIIAAIEVIRTGNKEPEFEDLADERDKLIDLRGTKVTYQITSLGGFVAMLTFVLGQPPLVMFTLFIFFGVLAQVIGDITRLMLYRRGF